MDNSKYSSLFQPGKTVTGHGISQKMILRIRRMRNILKIETSSPRMNVIFEVRK